MSETEKSQEKFILSPSHYAVIQKTKNNSSFEMQ
jgi:hypothetical protein